MSSEQDPIEKLIRYQDLASPSPELDQRVSQSLHEQAEPSVIGRILSSLGAVAAAACLVLLIWFSPDRTSTDVGSIAPPSISSPVRIEEIKTETDLGEPIVLDTAGPVLPMRQRQTRTVRWIDKDKNIRMEVTVPDQQVLYVTLPVD